MAEKSACTHQDKQYAYNTVTVADTNVIVLQIRTRCNVCGSNLRAIGLPHSNVLKARPFSHDNGLTISIPMVPEGESVIETETMKANYQEATPESTQH